MASAFSSVPPQSSPHDDITETAADAVGWPASGRAALNEAVRAPDLDEFRPEGDVGDGSRIDARDAFHPAHHCDRVPPADNATSFQQAASYVQKERDNASRLIADADAEAAVEALGRALHAAQDCFSHSNWVDLEPEARQGVMRALLQGGEAPAGLVLTAFEPNSKDSTNPDDPYPHDTYAKDSPDKNDESAIVVGDRTKYEWARDGAIQASAPIMAEFLGPLNETQLDAIAALRADETSAFATHVAWPVLGVGLLLVISARRAWS